ncbi:MAG: hypothetical protein IPQ07_35870, partial [Myxococcales bacterium]|nr:hypothetical protein [Myxococcales bacterium]
MFQLDEWFLPADPNDPDVPMQWTFPDGRNPTPCILAYTDVALAERRANEVVASSGGTAAVMVLSVGDAVRWMASGDLGVSWASFNHGEGSENFPLYFDQAEELAISFGVLSRADAPSSAKVAVRRHHVGVSAEAAREPDAGTFFPPEYKQFPFKAGDLLANRRSDGKFAVTKILKVDRWALKKGQSILIQGKTFVASEDDYLLIVSASYGASE